MFVWFFEIQEIFKFISVKGVYSKVMYAQSLKMVPGYFNIFIWNSSVKKEYYLLVNNLAADVNGVGVIASGEQFQPFSETGLLFPCPLNILCLSFLPTLPNLLSSFSQAGFRLYIAKNVLESLAIVSQVLGLCALPFLSCYSVISI